MSARRRLALRFGLRARLMIIGVVGLALGLAVGGVALVGALGYALQRTIDAEAFKTADAVAALATEDALPNPLPVAGTDVRVQVLDAQGRIRAASINADRLVPILYEPERARLVGRGGVFISGERLGLTAPVRVVTVPAGPPSDPQTVLVAKSMDDVRQTVQVLRTTLLIAFPVLVALLAVVAWRVIGATLRPVEALRTGAEEITGGSRPGQLPVPDSRDEIQRLAVTLNGMLDRLESARSRQRAFVADAAHELRSPLANMRTQLEVGQRLGEHTDWPSVAADLLADTQRLSRLVDDLLLLARADDTAPGHPRAGGAVELGELLEALAARYPSPPVGFTTPDRPAWAVGDPDAVSRVVANLLDNAVRHARREVRLSIEPGERDGVPYHVLVVTDDGPGIPAADRARVFERFTRLDDARARDAGGAGLGLAIVRELVRQVGGAVELSDAGPGVRAAVFLPVAETTGEDGSATQAGAVTAAGGTASVTAAAARTAGATAAAGVVSDGR